MSAILSADDLNDFISPGVACIKPVETLPAASQAESSNPYEVTTEDQVAATEAKLQAAQISLTDCLACSGCVTSAEAVLVSLQSHNEVLSVLDSEENPSDGPVQDSDSADSNGLVSARRRKRVFVASISPQTRASLAAATGKSTKEIGHMIDRLLLESISLNGKRGFDYVVDTDPLLSVCQHLAAREVDASLSSGKKSSSAPKLPILTSECPGFVCYLEKTHPAVLPHLSKLKSPQALLGTLIKSLLPKHVGDDVQIYHVAVMPCFDKKLEASRAELTDAAWKDIEGGTSERDVDCVITTRELLQLAAARDVVFKDLPSEPLSTKDFLPLPLLQKLVETDETSFAKAPGLQAGTSGGYLASIMKNMQSKNLGSSIVEKRGRNSDVAEYILLAADGQSEILRMARYYGFRNIQNLVRKLKPAKIRMLPGAAKRVAPKTARMPASRAGASASGSEYCYAEVMACPGGCTNGGGQLKSDDSLLTEPESVSIAENTTITDKNEAKAWLSKVDEAYFSADEDSAIEETIICSTSFPGQKISPIDDFLQGWTLETGVKLDKLAYTTYRAVESDVGKVNGEMSTAQAAELAQKIGGGW